jgi:hypothetical protein
MRKLTAKATLIAVVAMAILATSTIGTAAKQTATSNNPQAGGGNAGSPKTRDPLNTPTVQQLSKNWTAAQRQAYQSRLQRAQGYDARTGLTPTYCCIPSSAYVTMTVFNEGAGDCMCGPATATEMFSTLTHYYNNPTPALTLAQVEKQMNITCSLGTYRYQLRNEMNAHQTVHTAYNWQAVASASDVHYYTSYDLGLYWFPVAYDGETYSSRNGYPLDNYQSVDWQHYFPAYGYSPGYLYVADPHFARTHKYTDKAIYLFIDNFPDVNVILW